MNKHKYDTPLNEHLVTASAMCAFRFGLDKLCLFAIPDFENVGYVQGWLLLVNHSPQFISIAGGSEGLSHYVAHAYAKHLADGKEFESLEPIMGENDLWILNDDTSMEFDAVFSDAMIDAGFVIREDGGWRYKEDNDE